MTFQLWHLFLLASASLLGLLFVLVLAEPGLPYDIDDHLPSPEDHEFMGLLAALVDAPVTKAASIEVLTNGVAFYPEGHFSKPALDHHLSRALRQDAAA